MAHFRLWRPWWSSTLTLTVAFFFRVAAVVPTTGPPDSPVAKHGRLKVVGSQILDEHGMPTQVKGMSLFWSMWSPQFWNADVVKWLVKDWKISLLRAPMGVEKGGFLANAEYNKGLLRTVVDAAIAEGIYVIIDWHAYHADTEVPQASGFFEEMASNYGQHPGVIFEIFNEPVDLEWPAVKAYHDQIVPVIRRHTQNIIILGTPSYSQQVDIASAKPVNGTNLAYALHFYAGTHGEALREKAEMALFHGVALFASEWGTCNAAGNGTVNYDSSRVWIGFLNAHGISYANWAINDKLESSAALLPGASVTGSWSEANLSWSGKFMRDVLRGLDFGRACTALTWPCVHTLCPATDEECLNERCCSDAGTACYAKDDGWAQCMKSCTPGEHSTDPPEVRSPWSCDVLTKLSPLARPRPRPRPTPAPTPAPIPGKARSQGACEGADGKLDSTVKGKNGCGRKLRISALYE